MLVKAGLLPLGRLPYAASRRDFSFSYSPKVDHLQHMPRHQEMGQSSRLNPRVTGSPSRPQEDSASRRRGKGCCMLRTRWVMMMRYARWSMSGQRWHCWALAYRAFAGMHSQPPRCKLRFQCSPPPTSLPRRHPPPDAPPSPTKHTHHALMPLQPRHPPARPRRVCGSCLSFSFSPRPPCPRAACAVACPLF